MPEPGTALPKFEVRLEVPDLSPWRQGNTGVPGFITIDSQEAGPHVAVTALAHGNEIAGAIVLADMLRTGMRPARGRLTFGFINLAAFERFDPLQPTLSRFVDEDFNRVWHPGVLESARHSVELDRAREIRPLIDTVDVLLDLHSMLWPSDPLILCGVPEKGRTLARGIGVPDLVVADRGHAGGLRLIDYARFSDPATPFAANLVEAGQHWTPQSVSVMRATVAGILHHLAIAPAHLALPERRAQRFAEVSRAVTVSTPSFSFVQPWRGGDVVARRNTLIALDGDEEIRTPHDDCLLVMPSLRPSRGHTAVRLARFV